MGHSSSVVSRVAAAYRHHTGVAQKAPIHLVSDVLGPTDWLTGPGDDGAAIVTDGPAIVVGGEVMYQPFVDADPRAAGFSAVLANVNDLAAMGASPLGIVDTFAGPAPVAEAVLEGMRQAGEMYQVPIVGGHLSIRPGPASLSAFGVGTATNVLSVRNVRAGQAILLACSLEGSMRDDFPFFPSFEQRRDRMADDVRLLAGAATIGHVVAAKDVSMAGILGSLAMLLEARQAGAVVDLDSLPVPPGVPMERWVVAFPAYAFLLCAAPDLVEAVRRPFLRAGLTCAHIGDVVADGRLTLRSGDVTETIVRFPGDRLTGLPPLGAP